MKRSEADNITRDAILLIEITSSDASYDGRGYARRAADALGKKLEKPKCDTCGWGWLCSNPRHF